MPQPRDPREGIVARHRAVWFRGLGERLAQPSVGPGAVQRAEPPAMVSEDFAFMLEKVPGAYIHLGIGESASLHHPAYAFNDAAIPYGSAFFARLVERSLGL